MRKLSLDFIKTQFEKEGYVLLSNTYKNVHTKLYYICINNHKHSISYANWSQGYRCSYCAGNTKLTVEFINSEFEKEGYVLLTTQYKNNHQILDLICPNGHKWSTIWNTWQRGHRCLYCSGKESKTIEFIKEQFEKEGYKLLTKVYKNSSQKLKYICQKGHKHTICWNNWREGQRCPICWVVSILGPGHPNWRGGSTTKPYCVDWTKEFKDYIKERDDYKCMNPCCSKKCVVLSVHHIDYDKENCDPNNLITLCVSCNSKANTDRDWHRAWYQTIMYKKYGCIYVGGVL